MVPLRASPGGEAAATQPYAELGDCSCVRSTISEPRWSRQTSEEMLSRAAGGACWEGIEGRRQAWGR